jgi:sec-independent protein translocase protein TatA
MSAKFDRWENPTMLGLDNPIHLAFILILLLLVFGAKRLPEMGRSLGAGLRGFKESISDDGPRPTIAEQAPSSFVQHASTTEPSDLPAEPAHREPAGTAV